MSASKVRSQPIQVVIEKGAKRTFASAVDWPGWARTARDEDAALAALAEHADRYAVAAKLASLAFKPGEYRVVERVGGTATTDFGAPDRAATAEREPLTAADARRMVSLVAAAWAVLDRVVAAAPASLRKGPRGGGRDRDAIAEHVLDAERAYARKLGVQVPAPRHGQEAAIASMREAILEVLGHAREAEPLAERGWPPRYAARRIAWHALDHAWEIENRSQT